LKRLNVGFTRQVGKTTSLYRHNCPTHLRHASLAQLDLSNHQARAAVELQIKLFKCEIFVCR